MAQSNIGFEFQYASVSPGVDVPGVLKPYYGTTTAGSAPQVYFGMTVRASEAAEWAFGYNSWSIPVTTELAGSATLSYKGLYLRHTRTSRYFFVSFGLDGSLSVDEQKNTSSPLMKKFYNQWNLVVNGGPSIPIGKFRLRGYIGAVVFFSSVNDSGASVKQVYVSTGQPAPDDNDVNLHFLPSLQYGFSLQYNLHNWNNDD